MTEITEPQYASVEQPFGCPPPSVHCPICGEANFEPGEITPCPHLAFMYGFGFSDYGHQSDDFLKRTEHLEGTCLTFDNIVEFLKNAGYGNNMLAIEVTYGGMSCGPSWYTDVYGFDFNTLKDESGNEEKRECPLLTNK